MKKFIVFLIATGNVLIAHTQIAVETITADEAVTYLVGAGVEFSNAQFTGDALQLGYLQGSDGDPFPIPSGIILSTNDANYAEVAGVGGFITGISGNDDLLTVANSVPPLIGQAFTVSVVNDVAILEFDFVPTGDILSFTYSFGSDEYLEWVNTQYNDVFGFFVAGPGISGPYSAPGGFPDGSANIAILPGTNPELPITISSVNDQLNSTYYINNNPANVDIAFDGFTVVLTATINVICDETYHIRLAIADGVDTAFDSIVVLGEGSFGASTLVAIQPDIEPIGGVGDGVLLESCSVGGVTITPPCIFNEQDVTLQFGGEAVYGVDYTITTPTVVTLTPGEDLTIIIDALEDFIAEGAETISITFDYLDYENNAQSATIEVDINDLNILSISPIGDIPLCNNPVATAQINGGYQPMTILWNNDSAQVSIPISELGSYSVTVTDYCGQTDSEEFDVVPPAGVQLNLEDEAFTCLDGDVDVELEIVVGAAPFDITWTGSSSTNQTATFDAQDAGMQYVTVSDNCDQTSMDSVLIVIPTLLTG
ncbi:MAG: choice-of-anchor L domain-containing protein, partial [Flavobacteriales bacterium]